MNANPDLTPKTLRELLDYNPENGNLYWKHRDRSHFATDRSYATFTSQFAGKVALAADNGNGYKAGLVLGRKVRAHRAAWAIHYGEWPKGQVDHLNHNRTDNRIANLRDVTHAENSKNQKMRNTNTSGRMGVRWAKHVGKWIAFIKLNKLTHLGCFDRFEDACAARELAERSNGFHLNHGKGIA